MKRGAELDEARYIETQQAVYCTFVGCPEQEFRWGNLHKDKDRYEGCFVQRLSFTRTTISVKAGHHKEYNECKGCLKQELQWVNKSWR